MPRIALVATVALLLVGTVSRVGLGQAKDHGLIAPNDVLWGPAPASLPAGAQAALLEGDPAKPGPFTLRIRMPDGYKIPPHYHPAVEHVTVLQGTFVLGMGEKVACRHAAFRTDAWGHGDPAAWGWPMGHHLRKPFR